jgi:hypothetical protein
MDIPTVLDIPSMPAASPYYPHGPTGSSTGNI